MEGKFNFKAVNEKKWLVIYTRPRWEKKVDQLLKMQGIESYCPLKIVENQWADRKKKVCLPLFNSYVFVKISERERDKVRYTLGVLNYIYYLGKPAVIRDSEIENLKYMMETYNDVEVVNLRDIAVGDRVQIKNGLFHNQEGKVIKVQGNNVLMVFDHLECALVTKVPFTNLILNSIIKGSYDNA